MKWECGEEGPIPGFQIRSCPRNCERRAHLRQATGNGKARDGQRPASQETSPGAMNVHPPSEGRQGGLMNASQTSVLATREYAKWPALAALALGILIVFGAGFAYPTVLHNATHDTRHAFGLPCH